MTSPPKSASTAGGWGPNAPLGTRPPRCDRKRANVSIARASGDPMTGSAARSRLARPSSDSVRFQNSIASRVCAMRGSSALGATMTT